MSGPCVDNRNQYALAALKDRRSTVSGELANMERQSRALRVTLAHIDAVLALFAPEIDPETLPARRPPQGSVLSHGPPQPLHPRRTRDPMTTPEIVQAIAAEMGYPPEAVPVIASRVGHALREMWRSEGTLIGKEGFRDTATWRLP